VGGSGNAFARKPSGFPADCENSLCTVHISESAAMGNTCGRELRRRSPAAKMAESSRTRSSGGKLTSVKSSSKAFMGTLRKSKRRDALWLSFGVSYDWKLLSTVNLLGHSSKRLSGRPKRQLKTVFSRLVDAERVAKIGFCGIAHLQKAAKRGQNSSAQNTQPRSTQYDTAVFPAFRGVHFRVKTGGFQGVFGVFSACFAHDPHAHVPPIMFVTIATPIG